MKTSKLISAITIAIAVGAMVYSGCKKDDTSVPVNTTTYDRTIQGVNEMSAANASFADAVNIVSTASLPDLMNTEPNSITPWQSKSDCPTIAYMETTPHRAVIDFGAGCRTNDGNFRSGKIIIVWEGAYIERGSYFVISFDKYALNHNKIDGETRVMNTGINRAGNTEFSIDANGSITVSREPQDVNLNAAQRSNEIRMSYSFHGTKEWISGMYTHGWNDDVYLIRGYSFGTTLSNESYKTEITTPLRNEAGYPYYTRGVLDLRIGNTLKSIDYGYVNNAQDDLASVTSGDVVTIIHLDNNPLMVVNIH